ncbi:MAG: alkaline phosphatase family protein, partial [Candidatus Aenigmatarchaeota archaeon]
MLKRILTIALLVLLMTPAVANASENKVLIIGLDGADWDIIDPLLEEGKLENIERVIEEGDRCNLNSSRPSMSPVAWTTFATGKNPGKHGVFSFIRKKNGKFLPLTSEDIMTESLWDITSENNLTSLVINVPMTYPPHEIKGKMIAGYLSL